MKLNVTLKLTITFIMEVIKVQVEGDKYCRYYVN